MIAEWRNEDEPSRAELMAQVQALVSELEYVMGELDDALYELTSWENGDFY